MIFHTLEPSIDPKNKITFLLDWELTMKCNLDCSYCDTGLYGGHDNSTKHPPLNDCLASIDFMFRYVDLYMKTKVRGFRYVVLNVYGGESLYHPHIVKILEQVHDKYKKYQSEWNLTVTTTTNAIVSERILEKIIPLIDEFTVSYHTENTPKRKEQFQKNVLTIKQHNKRVKCVVLMHSEEDLFNDANAMIEWLTHHDIRHLPRQLDHATIATQFNYDPKKVVWFKNFYKDNTYKSTQGSPELTIDVDRNIDLSDSGRSCCGGHQFSVDQNYKSREFFVNNKFTDWYCSVNHFFLHIKQVTGEIFTNKDCKMNFSGQVGSIGTLDQSKDLIDYTRQNLENNTLPTIQCKKSSCQCGLCAPKSSDLPTYNTIMKKYQLQCDT
jgi:pyruvate-formate lyase-activating enzyme